jgi:hypothetical protein
MKKKVSWLLCCVTPKSTDTPEIRIIPGPPVFPRSSQAVIFGVFREKKHAEFVFMYKTPEELLADALTDAPLFFEYRNGTICEVTPALTQRVF